VSANENGIKILANGDGIRLLRTLENSLYDASRASEALTKVDLYMLYLAHFLLIKSNLTQCLWQPTINPISAAAAAAATSAALAERASSVVAIAGMVCDIVFVYQRDS